MSRKVIVLIALLLLAGVVRAQESVTLNQLKIGEITAAGGNASFSFSAAVGQSLKIEIVEVTSGFAPQFTLTDASGALVKAVGNPTHASDVADSVTFAQAGNYIVAVSSVTGITGQFVISVSEATPAVPPTPLSIGQPVNGTLASGQQITYVLGALPTTPLTLTVDGGVSGTLRNLAGDIVASISSQLDGGAMNLPAGAETYQLELLNDSTSASVNYMITLVTRGQAVVAPVMTPVILPTQMTPVILPTQITLPQLPSGGVCVLATMNNQSVNVRTGPDTNFDQIATISPQSIYTVVGRNGDSSWYQIDFGGGTGWVAGFVTRHGGDCSGVPMVNIPLPQPTPQTPAQPAVQIAGDNEVPNAEVPFGRGNETGFSGHISFPQGDRQDTITYHWTQLPSPLPLGVQFGTHIDCTGSGSEYAVIYFSNGQTGACTPSGSNSDVPLSAGTTHTDSFTIRLTGGDNAYVTWNVLFSWYFP